MPYTVHRDQSAVSAWTSALEELSIEQHGQELRTQMPLHLPLHWFVFLSRIAFVDTIFPYLKERRKKIHVIVAQQRHLKHLNEHGCTHNWAGINHENKFWTPISHLDDLFSTVLLYNSRMCFPYVILGWAFKNKPVRLS